MHKGKLLVMWNMLNRQLLLQRQNTKVQSIVLKSCKRVIVGYGNASLLTPRLYLKIHIESQVISNWLVTCTVCTLFSMHCYVHYGIWILSY